MPKNKKSNKNDKAKAATAESAAPAPEGAPATGAEGGGEQPAATPASREAVDVRALRAELGKRFDVPAVSRDYVAKIVGTSATVVSNWEAGKLPSAKFADKLQALKETVASGGGDLPPPSRPGRKPGSKDKAPRAARKARAPKASAEPLPGVDVAALRKSLGDARGKKVGRAEFGKLVGASPGSVLNWETGSATPRGSNLEKLRDLARRAGAGEAVVGAAATSARAARAGAHASERAPARKAAPRAATASTPAPGDTRSQVVAELLDLALRAPDPRPLIEAAKKLLAP